MSNPLRDLPSVDACLRAVLSAEPAYAGFSCLKELTRAYLDDLRARIRAGAMENPELARQLPNLLAFIRQSSRSPLRRVINASGVIIHTNLGRSVLAPEASAAVAMAADNYCNLELDMRNGGRGSRHDICESLLTRLTGAESAIVVNNNAAAVFLMLNTLCKGGEVIVSRGELVEIGGSFRIPDIMTASGAALHEVGSTNRTHLRDYQKAINGETRAILRAHPSNFRIIGFHAEVDLPELKKLAQSHDLPLLFDFGSGNLLAGALPEMPDEPSVSSLIASGADLLCFSGDKCLGGPQAGIIVGKKALIEKLKVNPLMRALRCDKLCLAALAATLRLYLEPARALESIPTLRMMRLRPDQLAREARSLKNKISKALAAKNISCAISLKRDNSRIGGGSYPECDLGTTLVCLKPAACGVQSLKDHLLALETPLIGRLEKDAFCLDPRTLNKSHYDEVAELVAAALARPEPQDAPEI